LHIAFAAFIGIGKQPELNPIEQQMLASGDIVPFDKLPKPVQDFIMEGKDGKH